MHLNKEKLIKLFEKFKGLKVLVVGDIILDRYLFGEVERISPEAPVPVVDVRREEFRLGGAGNVANNLRALGAEVFLVGVLGQDYGMHIVKGFLKEKGIHDLTVVDPERPTTEKTRVVAVSQQLLRIDREERKKIEGKVLQKVLEALDTDCAGVVVSDYNKGVVCKELMDRIREKNVPFFVDPRPQNKDLYTDAYLMTPNEKEALSMGRGRTLEELGWNLKESLRLKNLAITLGPKGIAFFSERMEVFPAKARQVYDVTGAGDTVISAMSACMLVGEDHATACEFANLCAGVVVGKLGTAVVSMEELLEYLQEGQAV